MNTKSSKKGDLVRQSFNTIDSALVYGKIPPQAVDLEEGILGALLLERTAMDIVIEFMKPEVFYKEAHQQIFSAMLRLYEKSIPIDILTVVQELNKMELLEAVGGPYYVTKLTNSVVSTANIETHSRIILEKFMLRQVIRIGGDMVAESYEGRADIFEILNGIETNIENIFNKNVRGTYTPIDRALVKTITRIEKLRQSGSDITGIPSGYSSLDKFLHGWQDTDLIILAARPSVGKTALALNFAWNAATNLEKPVPVAFFSLEMSVGQLTERLLSLVSGIGFEKIKTGRLEEDEMKQLYERGIQVIAEAPMFIDDTPALNIFELRARARRMKTKHKIGMIIIDYLQLMSGTNENRHTNREQEISKISRDLKGLAKDLGVPILALSQLSREVERRKEGNKMPQLSDLRESGAIEQDADEVIFIYRPEYYDITSNEMGDSNRGETHLKIAKNRQGDLGIVQLQAELWCQRFRDADLNAPTSVLRSDRTTIHIAKPDFFPNNYRTPFRDGDERTDLFQTE